MRSFSWSRGVNEEDRVQRKFYGPQTNAGRRDLKLQAPLVSTLRAWKLACPASWRDLVFCQEDSGRSKDRMSCVRDCNPALCWAKLRKVNVKTLRHAYASGRIKNNAPITEVQHKVGRSSL